MVKTYSPELGEFLVLNELQLRYSTDMPRRMRAYAALAEERYKLPTYPVLINILPPPETATVQSGDVSSFLGLEARQDYRVINLWEVEVEQVFRQPLPSLVPFVPILKGGNEPSVIQQALLVLRSDEQFSQLESLLAFFASFVLDTALVQQIMRWDMAVLQESPWYQEIMQQGSRRQLLRVVQRKFGDLPLELETALQSKSLEQLDSLMDTALEANTLEDFMNALSSQSNNAQN